MENVKKILLVVAIIVVVIGLCGVGYTIYQAKTTEKQNPIATIEVENFGTIKVELYPDIAPNTVTNFIALASSGYYNHSSFHRIVDGFMIQGGSKNGDSTTRPTLADAKEGGASDEYTIEGEFIANGFRTNTLKHTKGVISMARSDYSSLGKTKEGYDSAGAQFFIMLEDNTSLDGLYAAFGKVIEGLDIVEKLGKVETKVAEDSQEDANAEKSTPVETPIITSVTVETFGVDYGEPDTETPFDYYNYMMQQYSTSAS